MCSQILTELTLKDSVRDRRIVNGTFTGGRLEVEGVCLVII